MAIKTESATGATAATPATTEASEAKASRSARSARTPHYQSGRTSPGDEIVREAPRDAVFISGHAPGPDGWPRRDSGGSAHFSEDGGRGSESHRDEFLG